MNETVIFRADASTHVGTGHVMRCLALAQAWQDAGGHAIFMTAPGAPVLEERLQSEGMELIPMPAQPGSSDDADQTVNLAQKVGASWVVVDGYHFGADYQRFVKDAGLRLLFIDDNGHSDHYYADILLNQNLHAHEGLYPNRESYTRLLLGTRYVLLRREFLKWRGWKREIPTVARKVLVTLGGADPNNVTVTVIQALQHVEVNGLEAVIVVGGSNPHCEELQSAIRHLRVPVRLERHVTNMAELMVWADVAISAAGTTSLELAFTGLPSLVLVVADNQYLMAERLETAGVAVNLSSYKNLSPPGIAHPLTRLVVAAERRAEMAQRGQKLVDGEGAARALMPLTGRGLRLRQVGEDDFRLVWEWANDLSVREVSFSSESISWEQHLKWLGSKLNDSECILYIAINEEETPVGQVRYDVSGHAATISISIDANLRGKGYGSAIIKLASQKVCQISPVKIIHAYIKTGNEASTKAFLKAGFSQVGAAMICGQPAVHLILQREEIA